MSGTVSPRGCIASVCLVLLAGCGGGGGGNGTEANLAPFTVSVTVGGLSGTVVLQNNGKDNLSVSANGSKTFATALIKGDGYNVTVLTHPGGQSCTVTNGSGAIQSANVNIAVGCALVAPALSLQPGVKQLQFTWPANPAATHYRVMENPDGVSGYTQLGTDFTIANYTLDLGGLLLSKRLGASYIVESCYSFGCTDSTPLNLVSQLLNLIGYFKASNTGSGDAFGLALALSADGSTLAVGASSEDSAATGINNTVPGQGSNTASGAGAVYVFTRSGAGWSQQAYVKASNTGANDGFGTAVALSADGSTLAVGASVEASAATGINNTVPGQGDNTASGAGAVYVFTRSGVTWTQQAYVKASNTGANDLFGSSLALSADGNTLAVGAVLEASAATGINNTVPGQGDNTASSAGAVYVFTRSGATWSQQAYVKASNTGAGDEFGSSLALSADGSTLAVGALFESSAATGINNTVPGQGDNTANGAGAVYVFTLSGATWSQQAYVKASNAGAGDNFGASIALSADGNTLAVGAFGEDSAATGINNTVPGQGDNAADGAGAVYVFTRSGATWSQQAYVKASNAGAADQFGLSVALSSDGNTLAVGAQNEFGGSPGLNGDQADNSVFGAGAAYLFTRSGATWSQHAYVKASNPGSAGAVGDLFGHAVALSGDGSTLAVGAFQEASGATGIGGNQADNSATNAGAVYLY